MSVYTRRQTVSVHVGNTAIGGSNPIRLQSMTTVSTMDTEGCIDQAIRIINAGGELVRMTTQGTREAENMRLIREGLTARGFDTPLVADVHFNPAVADVAARYVEKVRINPGNYVDPARTFKHLEYTDQEYAQEIQRIRDRFIPFLNICREHGTAIRIGVNHGSLSDRIMSRYGNTPAGMVESCMEFLRICISEDKVREILKIAQEPVSLETPIGEEDDSHLGDFIPDDDAPAPADAVAVALLKEQLTEVLNTLTPREAKVLRLRYGLDDGLPALADE